MYNMLYMADTLYTMQELIKYRHRAEQDLVLGDLIASESDRAEQDLQKEVIYIDNKYEDKDLLHKKNKDNLRKKMRFRVKYENREIVNFKNSGEDKKERITTPDAFFLGVVALFLTL